MKILESQPKLVEQVHKAILSEIAEAKLKAGSRIIQEQIAQELGVSRQPVQQALVLLKNQGVLTEAPGRGLQVAPLNLELIRQMYEVCRDGGLGVSPSLRKFFRERQEACREITCGGSSGGEQRLSS